MPKILYLGPNAGTPKLNLDVEAASIEEIVGKESFTSYLGDITLNRVSEIFKSAEWDIIIIGAHGAPGQIMFVDGYATPSWLALQLKQANPRVVILGACWSGMRSQLTLRAMAEEISASGIDTVAMIRDVANAAAITYSTEFIRAIMAGATPRLAHIIAIEQVQQISPKETETVVFVPGQHDDKISKAELDRIVQGITELGNKIDAELDSLASIPMYIKNLTDSITCVSDTVTSVVKENEAQKRMLQMLSDSQGAFAKLVDYITARG